MQSPTQLPGSSSDEVKPPILNSCLAYMRFLMNTRDKSYVQDSVCARFTVNILKAAHKALSKFCDPALEYNVRGPTKSSPREKAVFFFDESYKILVKLDRQALSPVLACPSDELGTLLDMNGPCDHKMMENRFQSLEDKVSLISGFEKSLHDLKCTVASMGNSSDKQLAATAITVAMSDRIKEQSNQCVANVSNSVPDRSRASSISSLKRVRDDSDGESDVDTTFFTPKSHIRKEKKQKRLQENKSYSGALKSSSAPKASTTRRQANWGSSTSTTSAGFAGAVPELFISNCRDNPKEEEIKVYLESKQLTILSVKMMSQPDAFKKSFKIKVSSFSDYAKLISGGQYLPRGVAVKKFIYPRSVNASRQWAAAPVSNTPAPNLTSLVNHPSVSVEAVTGDAVISSGQVTNSQITEFYQHSEGELSSLIGQSINVSNNIAKSGCQND